MSDIHSEINTRIEAFVTDITALAKQAAYDTLSSALEQGLAGTSNGRSSVKLAAPPSQRRRKGGKRTPDEIAETADALLAYISDNPGQRMESIAKAMGSTTKDLSLPIKKLLSTSQITVEGQKRATSYYPASTSQSSAAKSAKPRRRKRRKRA